MDVNFKVIKESLEAINAELDSMIAGVGCYYRGFNNSEQEDIAELVVKALDEVNQLNEEVVRIDFELNK